MHRRTHPLVKASLLIALTGSASFAGLAIAGPPSDDDLGEATGLSPTSALPPQPKAPPSEPSAYQTRLRGYVYGEGLLTRPPAPPGQKAKTTRQVPNLELSLTTDVVHEPSGLSAFLEGRLNYEAGINDSSSVLEPHLDQGGFRWQASERVSFGLGKERNRRAPGLLISPSDFIHSHENLPGMRLARNGEWLLRGSWQAENRSLDGIYLPVDKVNEQGMPKEGASARGQVVRYLERLGGYDLALDVGRLEDHWEFGGFTQTIVAQVWKAYVELGHSEASDSTGALAGLSYEGSDDYSARAEVIRGGKRDASLFLRPDTNYGLVSLALPEVKNRFNVTETWIHELTDGGWINAFRAEWLVNSWLVVGMQHIQGGSDVWQAGADIKASF